MNSRIPRMILTMLTQTLTMIDERGSLMMPSTLRIFIATMMVTVEVKVMGQS